MGTLLLSGPSPSQDRLVPPVDRSEPRGGWWAGGQDTAKQGNRAVPAASRALTRKGTPRPGRTPPRLWTGAPLRPPGDPSGLQTRLGGRAGGVARTPGGFRGAWPGRPAEGATARSGRAAGCAPAPPPPGARAAAAPPAPAQTAPWPAAAARRSSGTRGRPGLGAGWAEGWAPTPGPREVRDGAAAWAERSCGTGKETSRAHLPRSGAGGSVEALGHRGPRHPPVRSKGLALPPWLPPTRWQRISARLSGEDL